MGVAITVRDLTHIYRTAEGPLTVLRSETPAAAGEALREAPVARCILQPSMRATHPSA